MGRAPASNWVIGRSPSINSMVRSIEVVLYMRAIHRVVLDVGRDQKRGRAVRIHVVGAVLRVVLQHEDGGARPEAALRNRLHQHPQRVVVIGGHGEGGELACLRAVGVIVAQPHEHQPRHVRRISQTPPGRPEKP